jgi:16S rRNA (guanine(966)-N(2))-methyltransferase RsmD
MARRKPNRSSKPADRDRPAGLRIVGGKFRGRKLKLPHERDRCRVRPMKDRVREALFNLVGPSIRAKHAIDLFAGSGAIGLEALSRGAARATMIEQHYPTADILRQNVAILAVDEIARIVSADVFIWARRRGELGPEPWAVFCSPPYDFYVERTEETLSLIGNLMEAAPATSVFVVEADARFDFAFLPSVDQWDVRAYPPAVLGIWRKEC